MILFHLNYNLERITIKITSSYISSLGHEVFTETQYQSKIQTDILPQVRAAVMATIAIFSQVSRAYYYEVLQRFSAA